MTSDESDNLRPVDITFITENGSEGWEEDLVTEALAVGAEVLRQPDERGSIPPEVADGTFILAVTLAAKQAVNLVLLLADRLKCGVVIDVTGKEPRIKKNSEIRRGDILIVDGKHTQLLRSTEKGKLSEVDVAAVLKTLKGKQN